MQFGALHGVLIAACFSLAAALSIPNNIHNPNSEDCVCEEIVGSTCALHYGVPFWHGRFPNARGLDLTGSIGEFFDFNRLLTMDNYCSHMMHNLLCFHYFPQCNPSSRHYKLGVTPCREVCVEALSSCLKHARALDPNYQYPDHLDCDNFASGSQCDGSFSGVTGEDGSECDTVCTACPNATIHLEFATQPSKKKFKGSESSGKADVCLRLTNVGSYNHCDGLLEAVTINVQSSGSSAEEGLDFIGQDVDIVFPVGSSKDEIRCITFQVIKDSERERTERFTVYANITSPSNALFGGAHNSSIGSIVVDITDEYPYLPTPLPSPLPKPAISIELIDKDGVYSSDGQAEICLGLTNVGSFDPYDSLTEEFTVLLRVCNDPLQTSHIIFPVGAVNGSVICTTFLIDEGAVVQALINSPTSAVFGNSQSKTDSIVVHIVAQPVILVEFATEEGKNQFVGSETCGEVDVCLRLVNVGSHNPYDTLREDVTVNIFPCNVSAKEGIDFIWHSNDIVFQIGAVREDLHCVSIDIVMDDEAEDMEVFHVHADITSPSDAFFVNQSKTAYIEVKIANCTPILVDFATKEGEDQFFGFEKNGSAEICLKLVDVGSCNPYHTLHENLTVNLYSVNGSAKLGLDFIWPSPNIVFPAGTMEGAVVCFTVEIVTDSEKEDYEVFHVHANITSPCNALFVDPYLKTTSGYIEVNITDHYEIPDPNIPANECKGTCNWRTSITRNTLKNNPYTFAAHIRVLECRGQVLDLEVIECEDIVCGVCPEAGPFKMAICTNCFGGCPVGEEFIVAGLNTPDSLYIANYKRGGVWAPGDTAWKNRVPVCS